MTRLPLKQTYSAIFGTSPGVAVAGTLDRLDRYLGQSITPSTAIMLCVSIRPIDLHWELISASERQLHDARLILETEINALRSHEALTIALQNETIRRLDGENAALRRLLATERPKPRPSISNIAFKAASILAVAWAGYCFAQCLMRGA